MDILGKKFTKRELTFLNEIYLKGDMREKWERESGGYDRDERENENKTILVNKIHIFAF